MRRQANAALEFAMRNLQASDYGRPRCWWQAALAVNPQNIAINRNMEVLDSHSRQGCHDTKLALAFEQIKRRFPERSFDGGKCRFKEAATEIFDALDHRQCFTPHQGTGINGRHRDHRRTMRASKQQLLFSSPGAKPLLGCQPQARRSVPELGCTDVRNCTD